MKVLLIHGANASRRSWNWIGSHIKDHERLSWEMMTKPEDNLIAMEKLITEPCIIVGHSMGGLYAWHLARRNPTLVTKGISIGTPWGGSSSVSFWRMFNMTSPWLTVLSRSEKWTRQPRQLAPPCPWTNVVTTHGFELWGVGDNDGTVTVKSQRELHKPFNEIVLNLGHNEVLQSSELIDIIKALK